MDQLETVTSSLREMMFHKCKALINSSRKKDDAEFKRWLCVNRKTYQRISGLVRIPLSYKVTAKEIKSVEIGSKEEEVILARKKVHEIILTINGRPKGSWTPERCLQFLLMCLAEKIPFENAQDFGFNHATVLKSNLAIILKYILIDQDIVFEERKRQSQLDKCEIWKNLARTGKVAIGEEVQEGAEIKIMQMLGGIGKTVMGIEDERMEEEFNMMAEYGVLLDLIKNIL